MRVSGNMKGSTEVLCLMYGHEVRDRDADFWRDGRLRKLFSGIEA